MKKLLEVWEICVGTGGLIFVFCLPAFCFLAGYLIGRLCH
jgi:hypothetical protein